MNLQFIRKVIDNHSQCRHMANMIHCLCNNINTAKVDIAASQGAERAKDVMRVCGTKFNCGQCRVSINARLEEWRAINPALEAAE
ncbi:(2Fe-2S)-binding protein [Hellea balneolensis]|uniref:(2Fe-2S)-binding protein n=1 Tax=Hellea balneolensis TaxID=287478 RepID=UPI00041620B7|nr:(2Fe-2S)-binding protein [Hellea balneolensis]